MEKVAVLDRTKEMGATGEPLYLDVVSVLKDVKHVRAIVGGRYVWVLKILLLVKSKQYMIIY